MGNQGCCNLIVQPLQEVRKKEGRSAWRLGILETEGWQRKRLGELYLRLDTQQGENYLY